MNREALKAHRVRRGLRASTFPGWHGEAIQAWEVKPPGLRSEPQVSLADAHARRAREIGVEQQLFTIAGTRNSFAAKHGYVVMSSPTFTVPRASGLKFMDADQGTVGRRAL